MTKFIVSLMVWIGLSLPVFGDIGSSVQPIVPPNGVVYGSPVKTLTSSPSDLSWDSSNKILTIRTAYDMYDANGCLWKTIVNTSGALITTLVNCPVAPGFNSCRNGMSMGGLLLVVTCP